MRVLKLKPEFPASVLTLQQAPEIVRPLPAGCQEGLASPEDGGAPPTLVQLLLLLERLTGAILGMIGVTAMIGSLTVCGSLLLSGPAFVIELLAGLAV